MHPEPGDRAPLAAIAFGLLLVATAAARAADAESEFGRGVEAFEAQSYDEALAAFEAALAAGLDGPAVHFNAGVAAYHSGNLERAEHAFRIVARTPAMAPLAQYNLGRVALARDESEAARRWFESARDATTDERLRGLAEAQLERLFAPVATRRALYAYLGGGHDDNVALVADAELIGVSGVEDEFIEARVAAALPAADAWLLSGGISWLDYRSLDRFDQLSANGAARYRRPWRDRWVAEAIIGLSHARLDGDGFETRGGLTLQAGGPMAPGWSLRGRYRATGIEGHGEFAGLSGSRNEGELLVRRSFERAMVGLALLAERNDHDDRALSSQGAQARLDLQWEPRDEWSIDLGVARRERRYARSEDGRRSEDRTEFSLFVSWALSERWRAVLGITHVDNAADLEIYDFDSLRVAVGIEASF